MESEWIFWALGAFFLGSVPFGKLISQKTAGIDITVKGSRNIGATNVAREIGIRWGLLTLVLDILKGLIPIILFSSFSSRAGQLSYEIGLSTVGLCALLGHQFPLFLKFRGGKGVSTALGIYLGVSPLAAIFSLLLFILVVSKWQFVSLGSITAAAAMPIFLALLHKPMPFVIGALLAAVLIFLRHRENIVRLVNGNERKWKDRKS